jgi:inhibitor of cysteine peptidase
MEEHRLSESDQGAVVQAQTGDLIEVRLHEMPAGGYRWVVDGPPDALLEVLDPKFEFAEGRVGAANTACFGFRVKAAGTGAIRLSYRRPWEKEEPPLKTYEATIAAR